MITLAQMKAARALLDWTQKDLAKLSGISPAAIGQIESGAGNPRAETMKIIQLTFEKYDIEFTDDPGVKIKREPFNVNLWQGREAMLKCWRDIEETLKGGGDVRISPVDDELWKSLYPKEMLEMFKRRTERNIRTLGLLTDPSKNESKWASKNYRLVPESAVTPHAPYYIYGDKVALIKMRDPIRIILIKSPTLAESYYTQFQYHWDNGKEF
ncbi:MAG: helix-turn-helix domain-containing protein [Alphaproteobacteria bacterium]|nr:helix-turn-helix domain-containing protein [Alphaproteobacteria bacterium]